MNARTDRQLLSDYAGNRSEAAFRELVRRYVDLVYSAALRMVCDKHLAEDVTQSVFVALAQKAGELAERSVISGWLHRTAQNIAANVVRTEVRRRSREHAVAALNVHEPDVFWREVEPHLDAALGELDEGDRDVLLLRYFERKSANEIGQAFSISEEAAQKRVSRAAERLREAFGKQGVTVSASGLAITIAANAVQAAPIGLAATIASGALGAMAAIPAGLGAGAVAKAVALTALQKAVIGGAFAILAAGAGYGWHQAAQLKGQLAALQSQPMQSSDGRLQEENNAKAQRIAELEAEIEKLKQGREPGDAASLRDENTRLQAKIAALQYEVKKRKRQTDADVAAKVNLLKQAMGQMPDRSIPEFQFLTAKEWATVAANFDWNNEDDVREAMAQLRQISENTFLNTMMQGAFKKYLAANNNVLPADLTQLEPYFSVPVTDAMMQRYKLLQSGTFDPNANLVELAVTTDPDYDSTHTMSINGAMGSWFNNIRNSVGQAIDKYSSDHNGAVPNDPSQLAPYLKSWMGPAANNPVTVQKYMDQIEDHTEGDLP